jgi:hypothetical protein
MFALTACAAGFDDVPATVVAPVVPDGALVVVGGVAGAVVVVAGFAVVDDLAVARFAVAARLACESE